MLKNINMTFVEEIHVPISKCSSFLIFSSICKNKVILKSEIQKKKTKRYNKKRHTVNNFYQRTNLGGIHTNTHRTTVILIK